VPIGSRVMRILLGICRYHYYYCSLLCIGNTKEKTCAKDIWEEICIGIAGDCNCGSL
jgi:hypothetical protein